MNLPHPRRRRNASHGDTATDTHALGNTQLLPRLNAWATELRRRHGLRRSIEFVGVIHVDSRTELPATLDPRRIYVIGTPAKWAMFRCPCGHRHDVQLNLAHPGTARWDIRVNNQGLPSIRPSVDVRDTRRCHYWITDGRPRWHRSQR